MVPRFRRGKGSGVLCNAAAGTSGFKGDESWVDCINRNNHRMEQHSLFPLRDFASILKHHTDIRDGKGVCVKWLNSGTSMIVFLASCHLALRYLPCFIVCLLMMGGFECVLLDSTRVSVGRACLSLVLPPWRHNVQDASGTPPCAARVFFVFSVVSSGFLASDGRAAWYLPLQRHMHARCFFSCYRRRWVRDALGLDRPDAAAILRRCPQVQYAYYSSSDFGRILSDRRDRSDTLSKNIIAQGTFLSRSGHAVNARVGERIFV